MAGCPERRAAPVKEALSGSILDPGGGGGISTSFLEGGDFLVAAASAFPSPLGADVVASFFGS